VTPSSEDDEECYEDDIPGEDGGDSEVDDDLEAAIARAGRDVARFMTDASSFLFLSEEMAGKGVVPSREDPGPPVHVE